MLFKFKKIKPKSDKNKKTRTLLWDTKKMQNKFDSEKAVGGRVLP